MQGTNEKLIKYYYSTHYKNHIPKNKTEWYYVLGRIDMNFAEILLSVKKESPVLDIACGVGYLEEYLLKQGFTNIHAIDLSEEQMNIAKEKLQEKNIDYKGKVKFIIRDAFEYLKDNTGYNIVAAIDFLDHIPKSKIMEFLQLAYNAMQKDGFLFVRITNAENPTFGARFYSDFTHETLFTKMSLQQCLEATGFKVLTIDYERMPLPDNKFKIIKQIIRKVGLKILGTFLGISSEAFVDDIIAIAKK